MIQSILTIRLGWGRCGGKEMQQKLPERGFFSNAWALCGGSLRGLSAEVVSTMYDISYLSGAFPQMRVLFVGVFATMCGILPLVRAVQQSWCVGEKRLFYHRRFRKSVEAEDLKQQASIPSKRTANRLAQRQRSKALGTVKGSQFVDLAVSLCKLFCVSLAK